MAAANKGESWAILAASEMGKGVWLKQRLRETAPPKLLIWDTNDEYQDHARRVHSLTEMLRAMAAPTYSIRFVPEAKKQRDLVELFESWCTVAFAAVGGTIVVEELGDVTSPSFAPPKWKALNTKGRHHQGLTLYWCSQSPAFVDKASMGNATHMHVGYLGEPRHRQAAAAHMGPTTPEEIDALVQGEFIEYVKATKQRTFGSVSIPGARRAARNRSSRA